MTNTSVSFQMLADPNLVPYRLASAGFEMQEVQPNFAVHYVHPTKFIRFTAFASDQGYQVNVFSGPIDWLPSTGRRPAGVARRPQGALKYSIDVDHNTPFAVAEMVAYAVAGEISAAKVSFLPL
jgi:hypothetical protein